VAWQDSSGRTGIRFLDVPQSSRRMMQTWMQQNSPVSASEPPEGAQTFPHSLEEEKSATKESKLVTNAGNRRVEFRLTCKLGAEVYRTGSTVPHRCTLSDISEGGCYVEMPSPLSGETGLEIVLRTPDTKLRIKGEVLTIHPGFGMSVRFTFRDSAEREEILRLLAILAAGPSLDLQRL
jgi:hypothetical protein